MQSTDRVLVIAGPGTGKTELLSVRTANILKKTDTLPENILCLTFTESGAAAMRERLVGIIGKDAYKVAIHTFHGFGTDIISQHRQYFYNSAAFQPADDIAQYEILRGIFDELDYKNPLASMMNGEYTHLADAKKVISELKQSGGLTSDELLAIIERDETSLDAIERLLIPIFSERVSKKTGEQLAKVLEKLGEQAQETPALYGVQALAGVIVNSLIQVLAALETIHPTKPLTQWKNEWLTKDHQKQLIFKSRSRLTKLKALCFVYYEYLSRMEKAGLFDYDDMILQVVHAMEVYDDLKFNLQEKYLYIMVDEFQDTNPAQLRILQNLTDNPVNEGIPNILAVGDDDQAIYGFQGADVSNILTFTDKYPTTKQVVLTENYRSGEAVLTASRAVIQQGTDRLELRIPEINKQLTAVRKEKGSVQLIEASSPSSERRWITTHIQEEIKKGANPSQIAVLARKHAEIQSLLPYFAHAGIPVRYERQDDALEQAPIAALERVARVVIALSEGDHGLANSYLPELLAHPAWEITPAELWRLSLTAYESRQDWMTVMSTTPRFTKIHEWLVARAAEATSAPLETMLDALIGRPASAETLEEAEEADGATSPFFRYFFGADQLESSPETYLDYLSALRTIRSRLHDYRVSSSLNLASFVEFIELHRRLGLVITTPRASTASSAQAVQLLTAHKSKGLEFDSVYIYDAVDSIWGHTARSKSRNISYPENLPLEPAGNTPDERLRLFYVAMTRARNHLTLTHSTADTKEKTSLLADFLTVIDLVPKTLEEPSLQEQRQAAEIDWYQPLVTPTPELKELLAPRLETYKLSATALTAFLDVSDGGPQGFLLNTLLRFPRATTPAIAYGNAIHDALQQAHVHAIATGEQKPLEDILHDFELALKRERLSASDQTAALQKGSEQLPIFLASPQVTFSADQKAELAFAHQDVQLESARLTGKLDLVDIDTKGHKITVTDYKTGRPPLGWNSNNAYEERKLHKYRQQLLFYKLLVEHSRDYGKYTVEGGRLAFVQPTNRGEVVTLDMTFTSEEIERAQKLIEAVWKHIMDLDLPDTSGYKEGVAGITAFEDDLIDGKV